MDEYYEVECEDCGWSGHTSELEALTHDLDDLDFSYCPDCGSKNIVDFED